MPDEMDYYFSGEDFDDDFYTDAVITSKSEAVAANVKQNSTDLKRRKRRKFKSRLCPCH